MLKSSPPFFAHHTHANKWRVNALRNSPVRKHRLEPDESIQHSKVQHKPSHSSQREKGLERKCISYNRTLMFSTINKRWDGSILEDCIIL